MKIYYQLICENGELMLLVSDKKTYLNDDHQVYSKIENEFNQNVDGMKLDEYAEASYGICNEDGDVIEDMKMVENAIKKYLPNWEENTFVECEDEEW